MSEISNLDLLKDFAKVIDINEDMKVLDLKGSFLMQHRLFDFSTTRILGTVKFRDTFHMNHLLIQDKFYPSF